MKSAEQFRVRVKDLAEDSIEKCWIPRWKEVSCQAMSDSLAKVFINLCMMPDASVDEIIEEAIGKDFMLQLVCKSMKPRFKIELDNKTAIWLSVICNSPGVAVMIFAFMKYRMHEMGLTKMDFDTFNRQIFPIGIPTEDDLSWLWECQKLKAETEEEFDSMVGTGNLLDCAKAYKSFI